MDTPPLIPTRSRRTFLAASSAAALGLAGRSFLGLNILSQPLRGNSAPSSRINLAVIGLNRGKWFIDVEYLPRADVRVAAVCDVDSRRAEEAKAAVDAHYGNSDCRIYRDFREILELRGIDAVAIFTPAHWHCAMAVLAARAGKDIFLEKPMGLSVAEGRAVCEAVRRHNRVLVAGTQWRGIYPDLAENIAKVRSGVLGRIREVRIGSVTRPFRQRQPLSTPPPHLDFDRWLGPAPDRGYYEQETYWSECRDYSTGWIAEYGVHLVDVAQWALGKDGTGPVEVQGTGRYLEDPALDTAVRWRCEYTYADGTRVIYGDMEEDGNGRETPHGVWITGDRGRFTTDPGSQDPDFANVPVTPEMMARAGSRDGFFEVIRSRHDGYATAETLHRSTTISILCDLAMRTGRKLRWDPRSERFLGDDEANRLLQPRPGREPYSWKTLVG